MICLLKIISNLQFIATFLVCSFCVCLAGLDFMFPMPDTLEIVNENFNLMTCLSLLLLAFSWLFKIYLDDWIKGLEMQKNYLSNNKL